MLEDASWEEGLGETLHTYVFAVIAEDQVSVLSHRAGLLHAWSY